MIILTKEIPAGDSTDPRTADELAEMTDEEIIELYREDIADLVDGATWEVVR